MFTPNQTPAQKLHFISAWKRLFHKLSRNSIFILVISFKIVDWVILFYYNLLTIRKNSDFHNFKLEIHC